MKNVVAITKTTVVTDNLFTVVLLRDYHWEDIPEHDMEPDTDVFVAHVQAADKAAAVVAARKQVWDFDCKSYGKAFLQRLEMSQENYTFIVAFPGHVSPNYYGFEGGN